MVIHKGHEEAANVAAHAYFSRKCTILYCLRHFRSRFWLATLRVRG